jgi:anti-sigma regulatory factor (Ser/Thr protein kinase)
MSRVRARGEDIRRYILEQVEKHPDDISKVTAERFGITRQAVNKHLQRLTTEGALADTGHTRGRSYRPAAATEWSKAYNTVPKLDEYVIWRDDIAPTLGNLPDNVMGIWQIGFTEMFNNAIDHSGGSIIRVRIAKTAVETEMLIGDDGVGIFRKIQGALNLLDERHAILELAKGKLTTDPKNHSGQGIFFTSRMFDSFDILSGGVYFSHEFGKAEDWILEREVAREGTTVFLKLHNHTARTARKIYDTYSEVDGFGFSKTVVPVKLAKYGNDQLVSRSQAKRLLARVELFKTVIFDFDGVPSIGQAFADEIFRVFAEQHPEITLVLDNANEEVARVIQGAKADAAGQPDLFS